METQFGCAPLLYSADTLQACLPTNVYPVQIHRSQHQYPGHPDRIAESDSLFADCPGKGKLSTAAVVPGWHRYVSYASAVLPLADADAGHSVQ